MAFARRRRREGRPAPTGIRQPDAWPPHPASTTGLTDSLVTRTNAWTEKHRILVDFLTALMLLVIPGIFSQESGGAGLFLGQPDFMAFWWTLAYAFPLALRHRHPDACAWMTVGLLVLRLLIGPVLIVGDIAALCALYAGIARGDQRRRWWYTGLGLALPVIFCLLDIVAHDRRPLITGTNTTNLGTATELVDISLAVIGALLAAATIGFARHRAVSARQARLMRERNEALELSNRQQDQEAMIAERARLARDMHDVAAHTLSILIVLADGGRYAGAHDSAVALSTMRTIKQQADAALRNTTALLTAGRQTQFPGDTAQMNPAGMGADGSATGPTAGSTDTPTNGSLAGSMPWEAGSPDATDPDTPSPQTTDPAPSYARIDGLVQEARLSAMGRLTVTRTVKGRPDAAFLATHPLVSETLYRTVEESLSNIRKYSGLMDGRQVRALIEEDWEADQLRLCIRDDGQGTAAAADGHRAGYGLIGMRERVEACGGTLATGPVPEQEGGGFCVRVEIPLAPGETATTAATASASSTAPTTVSAPASASSTAAGTAATHPTASATMTTKAFGGHSGNPARWRQRVRGIGSPSGFSVADIIISVCVCLFAALLFLPEIIHHFPNLNWWYCVVSYVGAVGCAIPLAFLHPHPEKPAIVTASVMGVTTLATILLNEPLPFLSLACGLVALYALIAYGPENSRRWATPACVVLVLLAAVGEVCLTVWHDHTLTEPPSIPEMTAMFVISSIVFGASVLIVVFLARLHRERGMDPVLLASHRQALLRQREQEGRLAARRERERVSAQIHEEVARTLRTVSDSAGQAVVELEEIDRRSKATGKVSDEDSATIVRLFSQTAQTGRQVLAHIRELIGVLRSNETDEEAHRVLLAPVTPVATTTPDAPAKSATAAQIAPTTGTATAPATIDNGTTRGRS
jgi:signal transduction histidine kinase